LYCEKRDVTKKALNASGLGVQRRGRCEETGEREEKEVKKRGRQVGGNELHPAKYNVYFCLSLSLFLALLAITSSSPSSIDAKTTTTAALL